MTQGSKRIDYKLNGKMNSDKDLLPLVRLPVPSVKEKLINSLSNRRKVSYNM
jgi:hypothetical protein